MAMTTPTTEHAKSACLESKSYTLRLKGNSMEPAIRKRNSDFLPEVGDLLPCPVSHGPRTYALKIKDDTMINPDGCVYKGTSYPVGVYIYVDPHQAANVVSGDHVIALVEGDNEATFKMFVQEGDHKLLTPLNPSYPIISDPFRILGKIVSRFIPNMNEHRAK